MQLYAGFSLFLTKWQRKVLYFCAWTTLWISDFTEFCLKFRNYIAWSNLFSSLFCRMAVMFPVRHYDQRRGFSIQKSQIRSENAPVRKGALGARMPECGLVFQLSHTICTCNSWWRFFFTFSFACAVLFWWLLVLQLDLHIFLANKASAVLL